MLKKSLVAFSEKKKLDNQNTLRENAFTKNTLSKNTIKRNLK